jgi:uncharacterized protein
MQLPSPTEGTHPGESGLSLLEYVSPSSVVEANLGIFLPVSYRMHPRLCAVISELVYENRLTSASQTTARFLKLQPVPRLLNKGCGVAVVKVVHSGNVQSSEEEVSVVERIIAELTDQQLTMLRDGHDERALTRADVLVVSPFNLQVS